MKLNLKKNDLTNEYNEVSWIHNSENVSLSFPFEISALYSQTINRVIVEKYEIGKIAFYLLDGAIDCEVDIPSLEGYQFRGINKNNESKTGASLLFFPIEEDKGNQWRDIEQYELTTSNNPLGKYLDIYR